MRNDLQALGSVEMIVFTFPALDFQSSNRVIAGVMLIVLGLLVRILDFFVFIVSPFPRLAFLANLSIILD